MKKERVLFYSTGTLLLLIGIGAVAAGWAFIQDPNGSGVGISLDYLKDSPFKDFLIPGIVLFSVNGVASLIGAVLAFFKNRNSGIFTMILGVAMLIWIAAQVYWLGWSSWLQPTFLAVGAIEIALGFLMYGEKRDNHMILHRHGGSHSH
jgi:hypothetical protein